MEQETLHNDLQEFLKNEKVISKILELAEKRYIEESKDVVDLTKNYGIDVILARFYKTYKVTENTDNVVSVRHNNWIRDKYLFKNFKRALKDYDLYYRGYIKAQEVIDTSYYYKVNQNRLWIRFCNWLKRLVTFKFNKNKTSKDKRSKK